MSKDVEMSFLVSVVADFWDISLDEARSMMVSNIDEITCIGDLILLV